MIKNKFKNKRFVVLSSLIVISSIGVGAILASCKDNTKPEPKNSVPNQQLLTNTGANKTNNVNNGTNDNNQPKPSEKQKEDVNKQTNKEADKPKEEQPVLPKTDSQNPPKVSETEQEENKTQNQPKDENKNENSEFKEPELTENPPVIQEPNKEETQPEKQVESVPAPRKEEKEKEKPLEVVPEEKILTRDQLIEGGRKALDWLYEKEKEGKVTQDQKDHAFYQKDGAIKDEDVYEVDFAKLFNLTPEEADKLMIGFFTKDYKNSKNILKVKELIKIIWRSYWAPLSREILDSKGIRDTLYNKTIGNIVDGNH